MATSRFQIYVLALCAGLLFPSSCLEGYSEVQKQHAALFIFGDSVFDVGNNDYINTTDIFQSNFWPYGESYFRYPTGRFSNGRLIPDFIAEYASLPYIQPYLQPGFDDYIYGVNFASGGAGALAETYQGFAIGLKTQLSYFKNVEKQLRHKLGDGEAYTLISTAVYLISIGINDYYTPLTKNYSSTQNEEYVGMVIGNLTNAIGEIYKVGGRKFGIANLLPLGCLPSFRIRNPDNIGACMEEAISLVESHNIELAKALPELKSQLQGFKYASADFYTYLTERMNRPSEYGLREGKAACCGSGPYRGHQNCGGRGGVKEYELCDNVTQYVFFDNHPTETVYHQVSKIWWNQCTSNVTDHYNLKSLFEI
ncbi:GDSL esterase/lipase 1-like [Argentina anserina]|uniref:GDSL esterase/lipase 1-like n=1 Tax=Argentina anserina TaxID=57926 RepID=UPI0021762E9C|nr:GDSL esterase/lipase 1-like [Potentilla anserina]